MRKVHQKLEERTNHRARDRFRWSRIVARAILVLVVSISVCTMLAKTAPQRAAPTPVHLTRAGKRCVAATLRSLALEEKIGQMLMGRKPLTPKHESVQAVGAILIGRHHM